MELTQELVKSLFNYRDGNLFWKIRRQNIQIDDKAGSFDKSTGYYRIRINRKNYLNHRLIYLYHHGYLPKYIDHIDSNKSNNNIENLRPITISQNGMNRKPNKNSTSIYKGVHWHKINKKWVSYIKINGKRKHLGYFTNEKDAAIAYNKKATELFKEYVNLNEV